MTNVVRTGSVHSSKLMLIFVEVQNTSSYLKSTRASTILPSSFLSSSNANTTVHHFHCARQGRVQRVMGTHGVMVYVVSLRFPPLLLKLILFVRMTKCFIF